MSKGFPRYVLLAHRLISSRQAFRATAPSGLRRRPARTLRPRLGRARRHPISRIWSPGWPPLSLPNPSKASVTASVAPRVQNPTPNLLPPRHPRLPRSPPGQRCSRKSRGLSQARSPSRAAPSQRLRLLCARDRAHLPRGVLAPQRASPKPIRSLVGHLLGATCYGGARGESLEASPVAASAAGTGGMYGDMPQLPTCSPGTPKQNTVRDDPSTHSRPQGHEDQVLDVLPRAEAELSPRRGVGVVLDRHL